jgi:hypothetical protein
MHMFEVNSPAEVEGGELISMHREEDDEETPRVTDGWIKNNVAGSIARVNHY